MDVEVLVRDLRRCQTLLAAAAPAPTPRRSSVAGSGTECIGFPCLSFLSFLSFFSAWSLVLPRALWIPLSLRNQLRRTSDQYRECKRQHTESIHQSHLRAPFDNVQSVPSRLRP